MCMQGQKQTPDLMMTPEQQDAIASLMKMYGGMMQGGYNTPPMYSAGADPNQLAAIDSVRKKMGLGAYQQPGLYTAPSTNVPMTSPNANPGTGDQFTANPWFSDASTPHQQKGQQYARNLKKGLGLPSNKTYLW